MGADRRRTRLLISGRVQGVMFRDSAREVAVRLGLAGWVRNLPDGRVEAAFEGPTQDVGGAVGWCREGPAGARVSGIEVIEEEPLGETSFRIKPTPYGAGQA